MEKNEILSLAIIALLLVTPSVLAIEEKVFVDDYEITFTYFGAEEDDEFSLDVNILNTGDVTKQDVFFEIDASDPFSVDGDEEWEVGNLGPEEDSTESFRIEVDKDTTQGTYDLEFILEDSQDDYEEEVDIEIDSDKSDLIIGEVRTTPATLMPDLEDVKLEVTIENLGGGDATFVRARLNLPRGVSSSNSFSDFTNIGIIGSENARTATFFIDTSENIESGNLMANLELEYKDDMDSKIKNLDFDLPIKGGPLFKIRETKTSPENIGAGENAELRINIENIGEEKGEETTLRVFENTDQPFEFDEKTNFVGSLEPGESGTAVFIFETDDDAIENTYYIKTQIRTVNNGEVMVSEHTVPVRISESEGGNFSFLFIIPVILVIVLIGLLIFNNRKKKSEEDEEVTKGKSKKKESFY